ncbi:ROK family transcriptional regulator [Paenibacillus koleovorans]|uniref:ROK family transcriptional regulator n=1 Tax=Paenibacillus koleovorans TaxID=121608 RepID=UPI000FD8FBFE|nr:ROK family transcriptional regulator [Paenibacillus koleovorans]
MKPNSSYKPADLKNENQSSILQYVYRQGAQSIPGIAGALGMSKPTATALVDELVRKAYFKESGIGVSEKAGKRPKLYDFNPRAGAVLALHLGVKTLQSALFDLKLTSLASNTAAVNTEDIASTFELVSAEVERQLTQARAMKIPVLGIGVSVPGVIEAKQGILVSAAHMEQWHEVPIGDYLRERFPLPVWVDNESRNGALAEKWFGAGVESSHFISIQTKEGIGTGIILNGDVYGGLDNSAGEFGHTTIDLHGPVCRCSNIGCWELYAEEGSFLTRVKEAVKQVPDSNLHRRLETESPLTFELLAECQSEGDSFVHEQLAEYAFYMATGIINIINILNPELVILQGDIRQLGQPFLRQIESIVQKRTLVPSNRRVQFRFSSFQEDSKILGAATLAIRTIIGGDWLHGNGKTSVASQSGY